MEINQKFVNKFMQGFNNKNIASFVQSRVQNLGPHQHPPSRTTF